MGGFESGTTHDTIRQPTPEEVKTCSNHHLEELSRELVEACASNSSGVTVEEGDNIDSYIPNGENSEGSDNTDAVALLQENDRTDYYIDAIEGVENELKTDLPDSFYSNILSVEEKIEKLESPQLSYLQGFVDILKEAFDDEDLSEKGYTEILRKLKEVGYLDYVNHVVNRPDVEI